MNKNEQLIIGVDIGTQGTKTALYSISGEQLASDFVSSVLITPCVGAVEEDPDNILASVIKTVRAVMEKSGASPSDVAAIGMDGQMAGIIGIDSDFNAVTPLDSWLDRRCEPYIEFMRQTAGDDLIRLTGCPVTYAHGPKILRLKNEFPGVYSRVSKFVEPVTYVVGKICGLAADEAYIDYTNLHFSGFSDNAGLCWSDELCREFGIDMGKLPDITEPFRIVGRLSASSASAMGLNGGIPVVAGCGDQAATSLGAGVAAEGECFDGAGTASVFSCCTSVYSPDIKHRTVLYPRHVIPGLFQPMAYISGGGLCLKWFRDTVLEGTKTYRELEDEAAMLQPGCGGLIFIPHFCGRTCPNDPDVKGMFWGLDYSHGSAAMFRAVMESIAYEYRMYLDILCGCGMKRPSTVFGTGGGSASPCFDRIKADVLGMDYSVTERKDTAPFGAALLAGYGTGIYPDLASAAKRLAGIAGTYKADPGRHDLYKSRAEEYLHILEMSGMLRKRSR